MKRSSGCADREETLAILLEILALMRECRAIADRIADKLDRPIQGPPEDRRPN